MNAIEKYLTLYSEPESLLLDGFPGGYSQGVVVPAYREDCGFIEQFSNFAQYNPDTLIIVILNRPNLTPPDSAFENEINCTQWADDIIATLGQHEKTWSANDSQLTLYSMPSNSSLLIVDRYLIGPPIPADQGVGLARKIGNDILCRLIHSNNVESPWMGNTDADVHLPLNYFDVLALADKSCSAMLYPFEHVFVDDTPKLPTLLYEYSLNYYVAGLLWAGSPYAYHTVGSTLAVNFNNYCQVRGFPKRPAAEDFYLLNKLAKTGAIISLKEPFIKIQARESTRVPFGTGPAVNKIGNLMHPLTMTLYHPASFAYLYYFLQLLQSLSIQHTSISEACNTLDLESQIYQRLIKATKNAPLPKTLFHMAKLLKLDKAVEHCYKNNNTPDQRLKHLTGWFDGFKTLKFIHYVRDHVLGTVSFDQLVSEFQESVPFLNSKELIICNEKIAAQQNLIA